MGVRIPNFDLLKKQSLTTLVIQIPTVVQFILTSTFMNVPLPGIRKTSPIMMRLTTISIVAVGKVVSRSNFQPRGVTDADVDAVTSS